MKKVVNGVKVTGSRKLFRAWKELRKFWAYNRRWSVAGNFPQTHYMSANFGAEIRANLPSVMRYSECDTFGFLL